MKKGDIWVLEDEILRYAQNDKGGDLVPHWRHFADRPSLRRRLRYFPARGFSHRAFPQVHITGFLYTTPEHSCAHRLIMRIYEHPPTAGTGPVLPCGPAHVVPVG